MAKNQKSYTPEFKQQIDIYFRYIGNSPKCKEHKKGERQAVHMHYLPFGARLNKGILMVTQLILGFSAHLIQRELFPLVAKRLNLTHFVYKMYRVVFTVF